MLPTLYLVDDEPLVTRVLKRSLSKRGFEVTAFHDGHDVLDAVAEKTPDVLITDIEMPLMTGRELCETITAKYPDRTWPIFIVTSAPDLVHREWSSQLDDVHFVEKPVSIQQLCLALEQRLAAAPSQESTL